MFIKDEKPQRLLEVYGRPKSNLIAWNKTRHLMMLFPPSTTIRQIFTVGNKTIWDLEYDIDAYSRRIVPLNPPLKRKKFLILLGESFIFGHGVKQNETLPYYLGELAKDFQPYNYAISGSGPQHMLARMQLLNAEKEIAQKEGMAIFSIYKGASGSVDRSNPSISHISSITGSPYYAFNENGDFVRTADYGDLHPIRTQIYKMLSNFEIMKFYSQNIREFTSEEIEYTCQLITATKELFHKKFPQGEFIVLSNIWQNSSSNIPTDDVSVCLDKNKIKSIIYRYINVDPSMVIPYDGHPSPQGHLLKARFLVKELGLDKKN